MFSVGQVTLTNWFSFDFSVAELKTLRQRQRFAFRDQSFNGQFAVATLAEHIAVARSAMRPVAIYPELKNPDLINSLVVRNASRRFEDIVLEVLEKYATFLARLAVGLSQHGMHCCKVDRPILWRW